MPPPAVRSAPCSPDVHGPCDGSEGSSCHHCRPWVSQDPGQARVWPTRATGPAWGPRAEPRSRPSAQHRIGVSQCQPRPRACRHECRARGFSRSPSSLLPSTGRRPGHLSGRERTEGWAAGSSGRGPRAARSRAPSPLRTSTGSQASLPLLPVSSHRGLPGPRGPSALETDRAPGTSGAVLGAVASGAGVAGRGPSGPPVVPSRHASDRRVGDGERPPSHAR